MPRTILCARVSTADQNIGLQAAQSSAEGFVLDEVVTYDGVSVVATRMADRPQVRRLFDLLCSGDVLVVRWVERLGRNYMDVTDTIRDLMRRGVVIRTVINGMTFDGATQDRIQQAVCDAQKLGIAAARAARSTLAAAPVFTRTDLEAAQGASDSAIARALGLSRQTIIRIRQDPSAAAAMLGRLGM